MTDVKTIEIVPDAVSLIESMRAVGYSVEAAIADLVDNSISANSKSIEIRYDASLSPFIGILDDGEGMTHDELVEAMRHGSRDPTLKRDANDLGRFGLGLKTASFSQCRKFTVVSKKRGLISALRWDLEIVRQKKGWVVVELTSSETKSLPLYASLEERNSGTLVVWEDLDRLVADAADPQAEMTLKMAPLYEHIALVFHRFTQKEEGNDAIRITVNGLNVSIRDPFLRDNSFGQPLEGQIIRHARGNVHVVPYVLPPVSRLSDEDIKLAGGEEGLRGTQGFYIYRSRRLISWGTWFKLVPKEEFYKLTRVQVDIPNTFDDLWALDIKKSIASPPDVIRNRLRELIPHFANASRSTITYPGKRQRTKDYSPVWIRVERERGAFRYEVNLEHPVVQKLSENLDETKKGAFVALFDLLSKSIPFESIYADMCSDVKQNNAEMEHQLVELAMQLRDVAVLSIEQILRIDPIVRYPELHERVRMELER